LDEASPAVLTFCVSSAVLALPAMSPFMFIVSPDVLAARRVERLRPRRRLWVPPLLLLFCVVIMPPRVCSSLCVVEELAFCAETIRRSAVTRANDVMSTNENVILRVMLLLLTDISPFSMVMLRTY
jgi:hypothetical protein